MAAGGPEWTRRQTNGILLCDGLYAELKAAAVAADVHFEGQ